MKERPIRKRTKAWTGSMMVPLQSGQMIKVTRLPVRWETLSNGDTIYYFDRKGLLKAKGNQ